LWLRNNTGRTLTGVKIWLTAYGKETDGEGRDLVAAYSIQPWVGEWDWGGQRVIDPETGWPWVSKDLGALTPGAVASWEIIARTYSWAAGETVTIEGWLSTDQLGRLSQTLEVKVFAP